MMKINPTLNAQENIVALINHTHTTTFTGTEFTIGIPVEGSGVHGVRNTDVTLTAVEGQGYAGSTTINYSRLTLGSANTTTILDFQQQEDETAAELLARIISTNGWVNEGIQWAAETTLPAAGDVEELTIEVDADHLVYNSGCSVLVTGYVAPDPELDTIFGGEQDGFDPVEDPGAPME